jgi:hypothetical protein
LSSIGVFTCISRPFQLHPRSLSCLREPRRNNPLYIYAFFSSHSDTHYNPGDADADTSDIATIGTLLYAARVSNALLFSTSQLGPSECAMLQISDGMDKPCRVVDFLESKGYPYVKGVGYPCFDPAGNDQSLKSKRDIGVMINVIITYKNRFVITARSQQCFTI